MSTEELAFLNAAKGEVGFPLPSIGGTEIEDVRVECVVENDLQLLNKSLEEPSSWTGKYARHKCSTPTRSSYKCPEKRDLPDFHFFHGRSSLPTSKVSILARNGSDSMPSEDDVRDSPDSEFEKSKNHKKKRQKRAKPLTKEKPKTIPRPLLNDWKNQLANNAYVQCPFKECKRIFVTLDRVTEHYRWCSGPDSSSSPPACETCGNEFPSNERLVAHLSATPCSKTPAERLKRTRTKKDNESDEEWTEEMLNGEEEEDEEDKEDVNTEEDDDDDEGELTSASSVSIELVSEVLDPDDDDRDRTVVKVDLDDERTLDDASALRDATTSVGDPIDLTHRKSPSARDLNDERSNENSNENTLAASRKSLKRKRLHEEEPTRNDRSEQSKSKATARECVVAVESLSESNVDSTPETPDASLLFNGDGSNEADDSFSSRSIADTPDSAVSSSAQKANAAPKTDKSKRRSRRRAAEEALHSINDFANHLGSGGEEMNGVVAETGFDIHEQRRQRRLLNNSIPTRSPSPPPSSPSMTVKGDEVEDPRQFYSVPDYPEIPDSILQSWKKESQKRRNMVCPHAGCSETYISQPGIRQHYYNCSYGPYSKPKFKCLVCGRLYGTEPGVRYHVKRFHPPEMRKSLEDSVDNAGILDSTAEEFVDVKPTLTLDGAVDLSPATADRYIDSNASFSSISGNGEGLPRSPYVGVPARGIVEPLPEALAWTLEYHKENFSETNLFSDWLPRKSHWQLLPDEEYDTYMPAFPNSMEFILEDGRNGERTKPATLNLFESFTYDQGSLTFVGGPVHAAAWAPIPLQEPSVTQYFAVGGTTHVDVAHFVSKVYIEPGLVQIYGCLNLDVPPPFQAAGRTRPEQSYVVQPSISLSLGIAHDFGAVWEMKWCPSGAYQSTAFSNSVDDDVMPRLGLLACACSDGTIRIFSIPHPDRIHHVIRKQLDKDDFISVCRTNEVITLSSSTDAEAAGVLGQCLSVDWAPTDGHTRIVGGFARGAVAIWDLTSQSPLVLMQSPIGPTIFPHQCFLAHLEQVQAVRFSPNAMDFLTTVSTDRLCRLWNTASVDVPINEMRRGLMTDAQWLFYWNGIITAQDDCFNMEHNATYFLECGYWGHQPRLLTPHNGTIWSVSASDWLNTLISADSSGEVVGAVLPQMMTTLTNHKPFTKRRFSLFRVELDPIKTDTQEESSETISVPIKVEPGSEPFLSPSLPSKSSKSKTPKSEKKSTKKTKKH